MEDIQHNKKKLVIVGGGGLGRELESWISQSNLMYKYRLKGYLEDNNTSLNGYENDYKIISSIDKSSLKESENVIIAIANCKSKSDIFEIYRKNKNFNIISFIHSNVILGKHINIGKGVVVSPNSIISCNSKIKQGVFINCGSQIGHDVTIGEYTSIMANVNIGGGAVIGDNVTIGTGAVILPGVSVADNVTVGAGAVLLRNAKKKGLYLGNPARRIL